MNNPCDTTRRLPKAAIAGCLLGTAVGDALGLLREGMSRRRGRRVFGDPPLGHALILGRGMCSDDTEHTVMVALAYLEARGDAEAFTRSLSRRLRWWLLRLPAGVGLGTLRAILKLWLGFSPMRSGVNSAGNGPAMRSAILGVLIDDPDQLDAFVDASTRITHTDPRAIQGARIIAHAARWANKGDTPHDLDALRDTLIGLAEDEELRRNLDMIFANLERGTAPREVAHNLGLSRGVSGYTNHTVPVALYCWLAYRNSAGAAAPEAKFRGAVESAVDLGGDTDTVAAITGALAGAEFGAEAVPSDWLDGLCEWPMTVGWMHRLADALAASPHQTNPTIPRLSPAALLIRNLLFVCIVLTHGFRRLLPPF